MMRKCQVRFGRGRMEKDAAGYPYLRAYELRHKRVYEKARLHWIKTSEHQMGHCDVDPGLTRLLRTLVILTHPAVPTQPGERPLDDSTPRQHLELLGALVIGRLLLGLVRDDHLEDPATDLLGPLRDPAVVDPIGQDLLQTGEAPHELLQDQLGPVPVLDPRRVDHRRHDQAQRVDDEVPLPAVDLLVRIDAVRAPLLGGLDALRVYPESRFGPRIPVGTGVHPFAQRPIPRCVSPTRPT